MGRQNRLEQPGVEPQAPERASPSSRRKLFLGALALGLLFGLLFWLADSVTYLVYFGRNLRRMMFDPPETLLDALLLRQSPHMLFTRLSFLAACLTGALIAAHYITRHRAIEERQRIYLDHAPVGIFIADREGRLVQVNPAGCALNGLSQAELLSHSLSDLYEPDDLGQVRGWVEQLRQTGELSADTSFRRVDGARRTVHLDAVTLPNGHMMAFVQDTTARHDLAAERERLLAAERDQRELAETLAEVSVVLASQIDRRAVLDEILIQAQRIVPCTASNIALLEGDALRTVHWHNYQGRGEDLMASFCLPLDDLPTENKAVHDREPAILADTLQSPDWLPFAETRWIRSYLGIPICRNDRVLGLLRLDDETPGRFAPQDAERLRPLANAAAVALTNAQLVRDLEQELTERRRAEAALRDSEALVRQVLDNTPNCIFVKDAEGRYILVNQEIAKLYGAAPDEMLGRTDLDFAERLRLKSEEAAAFMQRDREAIERQQPQFIPAEPFTLSDGEVRWFQTSKIPFRWGSTSCVLGVAVDITQRRQAQELLRAYSEQLEDRVAERTRALEEAQERLLRQERLAVLGQLAGSIAHELRTPLGTIRNSAYLLSLFLTDPRPEVKEVLGILDLQVETSDQIITSLLQFARTQQPNKQLHDANQAVQIALARAQAPEEIVVEQRLGDLPPLYADAQHIEQILSNLIRNAIQAMPGGGRLTVETRATEASQVAISVSDTGMGIPPENLPHLFEPLFTTKVKGIGLGLALVKLLVEAHEGTVEISSEVGQGATFTLYLPTVEEPADG